jgi:thiamine biosynthesis protein ThiS
MTLANNQIEIRVNGERKEVASELSVYQLLKALGVLPERVAIEMNKTIVSKRDWTSTGVAAGAEIEIVQFVGGG